MDVLTKGREALKKKGLTVAGDPTTKQRNTIREHRERGLRAYYKGNRLVVAGPLQYHPINRGIFADAARRGASSGRFNPGDGSHTARQQGYPGDGSHTARQQGNPGTNRHQSGRPREEYDSRPYHSEDGSSHWSGGERHSGPPTGRTNTGGTSTTTTTTHEPGSTTTAGVPGTGTRNGTISGPTQTGRTTTVAPTPSRRSTCQPGTPGTSHQWRHRATATPATRENSTATKETPWGRGLQRQTPRLQTRNHRSAAHPPSCNQKGVPLKTVRSQLQRGQKNPATKMSERGGAGGGGGQTTETPPACDQTVENTQTAHRENNTANRNPPQRDTETARHPHS